MMANLSTRPFERKPLATPGDTAAALLAVSKPALPPETRKILKSRPGKAKTPKPEPEVMRLLTPTEAALDKLAQQHADVVFIWKRVSSSEFGSIEAIMPPERTQRKRR